MLQCIAEPIGKTERTAFTDQWLGDVIHNLANDSSASACRPTHRPWVEQNKPGLGKGKIGIPDQSRRWDLIIDVPQQRLVVGYIGFFFVWRRCQSQNHRMIEFDTIQRAPDPSVP